MIKTKKISEIDLSNNESWKHSIFITLDLDWCSDEVLQDTIELLNFYNIRATIFVTHETSFINTLKNNPNIELGIHPNFNFLLQGDFTYGQTTLEVIRYYKAIIPDAKSVRSHSLTQNSKIINEFVSCGLEYDLNHYIPYFSGIELKPWKHWKGELIKVPFFWEDDLQCEYNRLDDPASSLLSYSGIKVFDFHPIHLFLNTDNLNRYENSKMYMNDFTKLKKFKNLNNYGVRDYFCNLCETIIDCGV